MNNLPDDIELLKKMLLEQQHMLTEKDQQIAKKDTEITQWQSRYQHVLEQWQLARQRAFGKSSEVMPGQGELFDEPQSLLEEEAELKTAEKAVVQTRKQPKRQLLPKDLPREVVVLDIANSEKVCDCCHSVLHRMGEDKAERLEFIPAQLKVIETVRPKYACRQCDQTGTNVQIKQRVPEPSLIPKGIATPSLLAQIISGKYQYALPLYRQEALFKQYGIELSRQTMSDWIEKCAIAIQPIYDRLHALLLEQPALHADETTLNVVKEAKSTCYMWVYCSGTDQDVSPPKLLAAGAQRIVLYDFQLSRSGQCPKAFLKNYQGYLQVDGYSGYEQTSTQLVGCWAHARRYFMNIAKTSPKGKAGKHTLALNHIQKLYAIEARAQQCKTTKEAFAYRQAHAPQALAEYKAWLEKTVPLKPPSDKLTKALNYSLNQWDKLVRYVDNPSLNIDNNRAERAIKPFVIGRKNWLFANTANGAQSSANLYSLIETAKANGLIAYDYLVKLFEELPKREKGADLDDLLPWNIKLTP